MATPDTRQPDLIERLAGLSPEKRALVEKLRSTRVRPAPASASHLSNAPLSAAQEQLWFLEKLSPGRLDYLVLGKLHFAGELDVGKVQDCLIALVERHSALRTRIEVTSAGPRQIIEASSASLTFDLYQSSGVERAFNFSEGPLWRAALRQHAQDHWILDLAFHHLVCDGWSFGVLIRDLVSLYQEVPLAELPLQYPEYAIAQRSWLEGPQAQPHLEYWESALGGREPATLKLGRDRPRVPVLRGGYHEFQLETDFVSKLDQFAQRHRVTQFIVLAGAWADLLSSRSQDGEVWLAVPVANRGQPGVQGMVGLVANNLVLRVQPSTDFGALLRAVQRTMLEALEHQNVPFEKVVERVHPARQDGHTPLVNAGIAMQEPLPGADLGNLRVYLEPRQTGFVTLDLLLVVRPDANGALQCVVEYGADVIDACEIAQLASAWVSKLSGAVSSISTNFSATQLDMWLGQQLAPDAPTYNQPFFCKLSGPLDPIRFSQAWHQTVGECDALRSVIFLHGGVPWLHLPEAYEDSHRYVDLSDGTKTESEIRDLFEAFISKPFELDKGLARSLLIQAAPEQYLWVLCLHHLIVDASAFALLLRYTAEQYADPMPRTRPSFFGFLEEERNRSTASRSHSERTWCEHVLEPPPPTLAFFGRQRRYSDTAILRRRVHTKTELPDLASRPLLSDISLMMGLNHVLVALAAILAWRLSGERDICVGVTVHNRVSRRAREIVGALMAICPLRVRMDTHRTFTSVVQDIRNQMRSALRQPLGVANGRGRRPYEVLVNLAAIDPGESVFGCQVEKAEMQSSGHAVDTLSLHAVYSKGAFHLDLECNAAVFGDNGASLAQGRLEAIIQAVHVDHELPLRSLNQPSLSEMALFNREAVPGPDYCAVWTSFEGSVSAFPDVVAVQSGVESLTYQSLRRRARQVAAVIHSHGVGPGDVIAITATRSIHCIVSILGVCASGAAWLCIDPDAPVGDREARLSTADYRLDDLIAGSNIEAAEFGVPGVESDVAYVMHTSGTTGRPKAVAVPNGALANHSRWAVRAFELRRGDRVLQFASLDFDTSVEEIFPTLLSGATLVLRDKEMLAYSETFWERCGGQGVTVVDLPTSLWHAIAHAKAPKCLRLVVIGGETAAASAIEQWFQFAGQPRLLNTYGPTEATIVATAFELTSAPALIGHPIPGAHIAVLDNDGMRVPVGAAGELFIGGAGVSLGYLNAPRQTAERFVPDPLSCVRGARMYRTGDRVRQRLDGVLEYEGRMDRQVKIRGVRIEPAGIETILLSHPRVRDAAVVTREGVQGIELVAYVVGDADERALWEWCSERLKRAMIPRFARLPMLPRNNAGKIDLRSLASREVADAYLQEWNAPQDAMEMHLADMFAELLQRVPGQIGVDDNFFELGGHSLLAMMLLSRVRQTFGIEVPLVTLFEQPTIAGLANAIGRTHYRGLPPISKATDNAAIAPLSFAQQSLWFLDRLDRGNPTWNVPIAVELSGPLDVSRLEAALTKVVERQEALRSVFQETPDGPRVCTRSAPPTKVQIKDLSQLTEGARSDAIRRRFDDESRHRFDLSIGPLLRWHLFRTGDEAHVLILCCHHIVCDGWSLGVLVSDLNSFYNGRAPAILSVQYSDYAIWQKSLGPFLETELDWWLNALRDLPEPEWLPTDRPRLKARRHQGASISFEVPPRVRAIMRTAAREHTATEYALLLAVFATLLHGWSGRTDLVIGSPTAGRDAIELEGLVGFFVNTLVLRIDAMGDPTFADFVGRVRDLCMEAQNHREVPFDRIVEFLAPDRATGQQPLFSVMFTFLSEPTRRHLAMDGLSWRQLDFDRGFANRDLTLRIEPHEDKLRGWFEFDTDLFERETIERVVTQFLMLLEEACRHPKTRLSDFERLTQEKKPTESTARIQLAADRRQRFLQSIQRPRGGEPQVKIVPLVAGRRSPAIFDMRTSEVDPLGWVKSYKDMIGQAFDDSGAVLLRGFHLSQPAELRQLCSVFAPELMAYDEASTPRTSLGDGIYTSTEYPSDQYIAPHNEMAYTNHWPRRIWFYCVRPAQTGGSTPIVDSEEMYETIDPAIRDRFEREGVLYARNFGKGIDLPWQSVFDSNDPETVEARCRAHGILTEWCQDGGLRTRQKGPAVLPFHGSRKLWFNSAHMFHASALPPAVRSALESTLGQDEFPRNAFFGDGSPIDSEVIAQIRATYHELAMRFEWKRGDLLMLDNTRWAHGRDAFQGDRSIWVTMA